MGSAKRAQLGVACIVCHLLVLVTSPWPPLKSAVGPLMGLRLRRFCRWKQARFKHAQSSCLYWLDAISSVLDFLGLPTCLPSLRASPSASNCPILLVICLASSFFFWANVSSNLMEVLLNSSVFCLDQRVCRTNFYCQFCLVWLIFSDSGPSYLSQGLLLGPWWSSLLTELLSDAVPRTLACHAPAFHSVWSSLECAAS